MAVDHPATDVVSSVTRACIRGVEPSLWGCRLRVAACLRASCGTFCHLHTQITYNIPGSGEQFDTIAWRSSSGNNDTARPVGQENPQSPVATSMEEQQKTKGDYATDSAKVRGLRHACVLHYVCCCVCVTVTLRTHTERVKERKRAGLHAATA